ncbi:acyltransferase domain-containing protein [Pseudarthrobacter sp. N5]|uniref:acyltransferase domain-containing protein n=1 Tax=Pseudarthrobacter sp. N5 TaxID=3418416 RepID=UPI003CEEDD07
MTLPESTAGNITATPDPSGRSALFELLDIQEADRPGCAALLDAPAGPDVQLALAGLDRRLGRFPSSSARQDGISAESWLEAILRFAPRVPEWHAGLGIPHMVSAAILADVGRQLAINRRVHGMFGADTWSWLTLHMAGNILQLGRLQFHLIRKLDATARSGAGEWVLGVHIPELQGAGAGLSPSLVEESLGLARTFFAAYFPDKPVTGAVCSSWMLDPYLAAALPDSNIAAFARRFELDMCTDAPEDAVYFTFRHRGLDDLSALPRKTSLQRAVLERIDNGGTWQLGHGHLILNAE